MNATTYTIDPDEEHVIELAAVPEIMERWRLRRPHINVVRRWTRLGVHGVLLPKLRVGPRLYTSREALKWWVAATSAAENDAGAPPAVPDVRMPRRPAIRRELKKRGLL